MSCLTKPFHPHLSAGTLAGTRASRKASTPVSQYLVPIIAACATWLDRGYGPRTGALLAAQAQVQTRQATTVAAWLRYPTDVDAALVHLAGPGGSYRLDRLVGAPGAGEAWRTWVDEVVVSWAACLLTQPRLAEAAVTAVTGTEHGAGLVVDFPALLRPDEPQARASALLRHPDLLAPVVELHRSQLVVALAAGR